MGSVWATTVYTLNSGITPGVVANTTCSSEPSGHHCCVSEGGPTTQGSVDTLIAMISKAIAV